MFSTGMGVLLNLYDHLQSYVSESWGLPFLSYGSLLLGPSAGLCMCAHSMEGKGWQHRAQCLCSKSYSILQNPKRPHSPNHGLQPWFTFLLKNAINNFSLFQPQSLKRCAKQKIMYLQSSEALNDENKHYLSYFILSLNHPN